MVSRRQFVVIAATFTAAAVSSAQSLSQGFAPLAGVNIAIGNQAEIEQALGALREFGKSGQLNVSEDKVPKPGSEVTQVKLQLS